MAYSIGYSQWGSHSREGPRNTIFRNNASSYSVSELYVDGVMRTTYVLTRDELSTPVDGRAPAITGCSSDSRHEGYKGENDRKTHVEKL